MITALNIWVRKHLGGHITLKPFGVRITIYGFNAMHVAINIATRRWGYICFHPPLIARLTHGYRPWYFYVSPNGTPSCSTFAIGPGCDRDTKRLAKVRREMFGHNFDSSVENSIYFGSHRELLG